MHTFSDALHVSTVSIVGELVASQPGSDNYYIDCLIFRSVSWQFMSTLSFLEKGHYISGLQK